MKKILLTFVAVVCCYSLFGAEVVVKQYYYAGPYEVVTPFMADSLNVNGKKYQKEQFIKNYVALDNVWADGNVVNTNDEGRIPTFVSDKNSLHLAGFYFNTDRFCTANIIVDGVKTFEVYIDGTKQAFAPNGRAANVQIRPNSRHDFVIKYAANANDSIKLRVKFDIKGSKPNFVPTLDATKKYSLVEVQHGRRVQSANISHDGKWMILNIGERMANGKSLVETRIVDRATGKILWSRPVPANAIKMMPKSNLAYYTRNGANGTDIITLDPVSREEKVFAKGVPDATIRIAPTEEYLILVEKEDGPSEKGDLREVLSPLDRQPGARSKRFIYKYDIDKGVSTRLTFGHSSTSLEDISKDGKKIAFSIMRTEYTERPFYRTDVYIMDVETYKVDTVISEGKFISDIKFLPDGKNLLITGGPEAFDGIGLNIAEGQKANGYDSQLYLFDTATKNVKALTKDFDPNVKSVQWNDFDNLLYVLTETGDKSAMYTIDPHKGTINSLDLEEDFVVSAKVSSSQYMIYYGQSLNNGMRLYTYDVKRKRSSIVEDYSKELIKDVKLGETSQWNFESSDGTTIHGRYYLPADFDPNKKYPMLVYYYAGTKPTAGILEGVYSGHVYASLGYVVYIVQPSGATGYGQEFSARHVNAWGKRTAEDIIEGVTKFCDEHDFVNRDKIGCFGASYGGFMTQYLQTRTDIFAAAISHAGISSISSYWGEGYWGYTYSMHATADNYPWNAPEIYANQSPLFNADKINTPILFLHGTVDTNVPIGESIQMFTALKLLGKETAFVEVKGEDHIIVNYNRIQQWSYTMYAWFAKWLQDDPYWWNTMYPEKYV